MLIAATLFHTYPEETRLQYVKDYYDAISLHDISLPTPVMAGVRTPQRQFSSCVLIETDDSLIVSMLLAQVLLNTFLKKPVSELEQVPLEQSVLQFVKVMHTIQV